MVFLKIKILFFCAIVVFGCSSEVPNEPPPGYKVLCNFDNTKFVAVMPGGTRLGQTVTYPEQAFTSRKDALARAWEMYNFTSKISKVSEIDTMQLIDCEEIQRSK